MERIKTMIVAIASDDGVHVAEDLSRSGGFVVFEVESSTAVRVGYRSNAREEDRSAHRAGQRAPEDAFESLAAALSDCGALISCHIDEAVLHALQDSGITGYLCIGNSVDQAAEMFAHGRLEKASSEAHDERR